MNKHLFSKTPIFALLILLFLFACSPSQVVEEVIVEETQLSDILKEEVEEPEGQPTEAKEPESAELTLYRSADGNFSIQFPATEKIEEETETLILENGKMELTSARFFDQQQRTEFFVMFGKVPGMLVSPDSRKFPATFASMSQSVGKFFPELANNDSGQINWIDYEGYQGQEIRYEGIAFDGLESAYLITKAFMIHDRIYLLLAKYPEDTKYNADEFFESFSILEQPEKVVLADWVNVESPEGDFALDLPTDPSGFDSGETKNFGVIDDVATINITSNPLPSSLKPITADRFDEYIGGRIDHFNTLDGVEVVSNSEFNVGDYLGFRFLLRQKGEEGAALEEGVVVAAGSRIYGISINMPEDRFEPEKAEALFKSFEILEPIEVSDSDSSIALNSSGWELFTSDNGGFSIMLPRQPKEDVTTDNTVLGAVDMHTFMAAGADEDFYMAMYYQLPALPDEDAFDKQAAVESQVYAFVGNVGGEVINVEDISTDQVFGQEFLGRVPETVAPGGMTVQGRSYIVDDMVYLLVSLTPEEQLAPEKYEVFYGSFAWFEPKSVTSSLGFDWTYYTSDDGDFRIEFPDRYPTESVETSQLPVGVEKQTLIMAPHGPSVNYAVAFYDYPADYFDSQLVTHETAIQVLKLQQIQLTFLGTIVSEEPIQVGESEGIELVFDISSGTTFNEARLVARIFVKGERAYMTMILGDKSTFTQDEIDRFFDSFEFLGG